MCSASAKKLHRYFHLYSDLRLEKQMNSAVGSASFQLRLCFLLQCSEVVQVFTSSEDRADLQCSIDLFVLQALRGLDLSYISDLLNVACFSGETDTHRVLQCVKSHVKGPHDSNVLPPQRLF